MTAALPAAGSQAVNTAQANAVRLKSISTPCVRPESICESARARPRRVRTVIVITFRRSVASMWPALDADS